MNQDKMIVEILEDGTFKVKTDEVSQANHGNAEMLLKETFREAGGAVKMEHLHGKKKHVHRFAHADAIKLDSHGHKH